MSIKKNISTNADFLILVIRNLQIKQVFYLENGGANGNNSKVKKKKKFCKKREN